MLPIFKVIHNKLHLESRFLMLLCFANKTPTLMETIKLILLLCRYIYQLYHPPQVSRVMNDQFQCLGQDPRLEVIS